MNTHQVKLAAFDFDGVIAETFNEWYFLGLKAFNHMGGDLPSSEKVKEQFRQARSFLKNAEDCYFVFQSIKEGRLDFHTLTQERFNQLAQPFFAKEGKAIASDIYTQRATLREHEEEKWLKLFSVFPDITAVLKKVADAFEVVIATTRDKASVCAILETQGIPIVDSNIIGREFSIDKREHMRFIADEFGISFKEIFFIDDILEHLTLVGSLGVHVVLASWGYSNRQQLSEAKEKGIPILNTPPDILSHLGVSDS